MDVAKEITKLESKKEKLNGQLGKLREAMEMADYVTKVRCFQRKNLFAVSNLQLILSLWLRKQVTFTRVSIQQRGWNREGFWEIKMYAM